jgi:hypothetical protein
MKNFRWSIRGATALFCFFGFAFSLPVILSGRQASRDRIIPLPEVEEPFQVCVGPGKVYIADKRDILVYDFKDGRFLKRIGKIGQGPGEFTMGPLRMTVFSDRLVVRDSNKMKLFSLDGIYSAQIEEPRLISFYPFLPIGRNYVGFPLGENADGSYSALSGCIYDEHLKSKKKFFGELPELPGPPPPPGSQAPGRKSDTLLIREYGDFIVYKDRIYVADSRMGLSISVFDENGASLYEIRQPIDKVKVPRGFVDEVVKEWKASKYWDRIYSHQSPVVPDYFPSFINFKIDGDRIYAITAARKDDLYEVIVMDLMGKILERSFRFPLKPTFATLAPFGLKYDVEGGKLVWFAYNDTAEMYELHVR